MMAGGGYASDDDPIKLGGKPLLEVIANSDPAFVYWPIIGWLLFGLVLVIVSSEQTMESGSPMDKVLAALVAFGLGFLVALFGVVLWIVDGAMLSSYFRSVWP